MITIRSFRSKILVALLAVALIPAGLTIAAGTLALSEVVSASGTAGPWQSVAESGRALLDAVDEASPSDPELDAAARRHRAALSESVRLSRVYSLVADRFLVLLPYFAVATVLLIGVLSFLAARQLSRIFSEPIGELVGWTRRIAREEPLPPPGTVPPAGVREFEHLRSALRSMAAELEAGRRRAVESARLRSWTEMARGVAHELKNPLTPMRMAARTVLTLDDPRAAEAGEVLVEEIDRLDEMARSFSRLGRMPEGPPAPVDVAELLEEVAASYRGGAVGVEIRVDDPLPRILGWYEALLGVFRNLVANGCEAIAEAPDGVDDGGRVTLHAAAQEGGVRVEVADTGPGVPEDLLSSIWMPDFTTKRRGTGLGLTLVRQAVLAHGGWVDVESRPGEGAVFSVVLPIEGPAPDSPDEKETLLAVET